MMKNKKKMLVLLRKRVSRRAVLINFYLTYISPAYYLSKGSFMFNKFVKRFFSVYFFFFKKFYIFFKLEFFKAVFYTNVFLQSRKLVFGNVLKHFPLYQKTASDDFFFFLKRRSLGEFNKVYFYSNFFLKNLRGNLYYLVPEQVVVLNEDVSVVDNFFFKGSVYGNYIYGNTGLLEEYQQLTKSLDFLLHFNIFFFLEVYKIHTLIVLKNLIK